MNRGSSFQNPRPPLKGNTCHSLKKLAVFSAITYNVFQVHFLRERAISLDANDMSAILDEVEIRYFLGRTIKETAECLGVAPRTVDEDWKFAKAWLERELTRGGEG